MEIDVVRRLLPEDPPKGLISWALENYPDELGGEYLIFSGERITAMRENEDVVIKPKKIWAARCTCTSCDESFLTQKVKGYDAIRLVQGEDGWLYTLDEGGFCDDDAGPEYILEVGENDAVCCPYCGMEVTVLPAKRVKGGRTKGLQVAAVHNAGDYTAIVYWLITREISEFGTFCDAYPRDAFVIGEKGGLTHFRHSIGDSYGNDNRIPRWEWTRRADDTRNKMYHDWGSINNKKAGSVFYPVSPSLVGKTGEKTGLYEYMRQGGQIPVEYLKFRRKFPNIENLVNAGHCGVVSEILVYALEWQHNVIAEFNGVLDLTKTKPCEMLCMTKAEYKNTEKSLINRKSVSSLAMYRRAGGKMPAGEFLRIIYRNSGSVGDSLIELTRQGTDAGQVLRYLEKQDLRPYHARTLIDARNFAKRLHPNQPLTQEELFPRHLQEAHDRLSAQVQIAEDNKSAAEYRLGFDSVLNAYGGLEWTDGQLCVRLPRSLTELQEEGRVLRHCVGGYGSSHISGKDTIFFIRHYRRPERPYYTLDICMTEVVPRRVQLHGYGNERHGDNKQYFHKIPQKVKDFCDRWEQEVLIPFCKQRKTEQNKEKTA